MVTYLGIQAKRTGTILRLTFAGSEQSCAAARTAAIALAERATTRREVLDGLTEIAAREGMVLETGALEGDLLGGYFWESTSGSPPIARDVFRPSDLQP